MRVEQRAVLERTWKAMGCGVSVVIVDGEPSQLDDAVTRIADLERRWSRFIPASEVTTMNRRAGTAVRVTADTRRLLEASVEARSITRGLFDPLVGASVVAAGYDRPFDQVQEDNVVPNREPVPTTVLPSPVVDGEDGTVTIPIGGRFDPGALGKGMAADILVTELIAGGATGACVEIGGDVRVAGQGPCSEDGVDLGWNIGIADPFAADRDLVVACLAGGAVATSSTLKRRWRCAGGSLAHHVIDPRTGAPSASPVVAATVIAANATTAEVLATAAVVAGPSGAAGLISDLGAAALLWGGDGKTTTVGPLEAFLLEPLPLAAALAAQLAAPPTTPLGDPLRDPLGDTLSNPFADVGIGQLTELAEH